MRGIVKHFFKRDICLRNIYIDDSGNNLMPTLKCKECGSKIGFIYYDGARWEVYVHIRFRRYKQKIKKWVLENTKDRSCVGSTYEREWDEILNNLKQWHEDSICQEWGEECEENRENHEDGLEEDINTLLEVDCKKCCNCDIENDSCIVYGKDPSTAVNRCADNGFEGYRPNE